MARSGQAMVSRRRRGRVDVRLVHTRGVWLGHAAEVSSADPSRSSNSDGAGIDLTGLRGEYPRPFTGALRWTVLGIQVLALVTVVPRLLSDSWPARAAAALLVALIILGVLMQYWRPPATLVSPDGLRVRKVLIPGRLLRWAELESIEVQNRWEGQSTAHTTDGHHLPLIGLTRDAAEHLSEAVAKRQRP